MAGKWRTASEKDLREVAVALGEKLRELREKRGMSVSDMSVELGTGRGMLVFLEKAKPTASVESQIRALLALGVSRQELGRTIAGSTERI